MEMNAMQWALLASDVPLTPQQLKYLQKLLTDEQSSWKVNNLKYSTYQALVAQGIL